MQKKSFFFAEMAYTHVGTKYIKRPWDFENFLILVHPTGDVGDSDYSDESSDSGKSADSGETGDFSENGNSEW